MQQQVFEFPFYPIDTKMSIQVGTNNKGPVYIDLLQKTWKEFNEEVVDKGLPTQHVVRHYCKHNFNEVKDPTAKGYHCKPRAAGAAINKEKPEHWKKRVQRQREEKHDRWATKVGLAKSRSTMEDFVYKTPPKEVRVPRKIEFTEHPIVSNYFASIDKAIENHELSSDEEEEAVTGTVNCPMTQPDEES